MSISSAFAFKDAINGWECSTDYINGTGDYLHINTDVTHGSGSATIYLNNTIPANEDSFTMYLENFKYVGENAGDPMVWVIRDVYAALYLGGTTLWYSVLKANNDTTQIELTTVGENKYFNVTWHIYPSSNKWDVYINNTLLANDFLLQNSGIISPTISLQNVVTSLEYSNFVIWNGTTGCDTGLPPAIEYLQINASNTYNRSEILSFSAYYTNNNTLINSTTNGTLKTNLINSFENITINTTENGGYYLDYLTNYNASGYYEANLTQLFYVSSYDFSGQLNFSGVNYTRNLSYALNYSCPDYYTATLLLYLNGTYNKSESLSCNNKTFTTLNNSFIFSTEGEYTTGLIFNTSYLPNENQVKTANQTFTSDLNNPTTYQLSFFFYDGFNESNGSLSLKCSDSIFPSPFYNISFLNVQQYYNNLSSGTNHSIDVNLTSGTNYGMGICSDLFGSSNNSISQTIYLRAIYLIDEQLNVIFDTQNLTNAKVFFDDNSSSFDFKANNVSHINFTSAVTNKLRFELEYSNGDIITRYADVSLSNGDLRVCANTDPTTHYEQLIVSATQRRVSLKNVFSNCIIGEDYTRFVYQDSFILRTLTRDSIYYLYSYNSNGNKVYLASLDGSVSSYYNIDTLEFNVEGYNLDITGNSLTFERVTNTSIKIFFKNLKNDSVRTNISIKNQNTSEVYFSVLEEETPNEFYMIFDFITLGLDEKTVLKIELYTYDSAGTETAIIRYFNLSGRTGYLSSPIVFLVGILLTIFGLSMVAARSSLGWFGLMILAASIGIMAFGVITWYILLMMAMDIIIMAFIGIILFSNRGQLGVT